MHSFFLIIIKVFNVWGHSDVPCINNCPPPIAFRTFFSLDHYFSLLPQILICSCGSAADETLVTKSAIAVNI